MEDKKNNPAVKDELTNNNFEDMNKIDFSKVYGEETVTKTTAVDQH
jgi:hypothetical protein